MKGYEDILATLFFLGVVLVGGYFYLNHQVKSEAVKENKVEMKVEKKTSFESMSKQTE